MTARVATCSCGQLRVTCAGAPTRVSMCHCRACQRRTGAPFGVMARFAAADVTVTGAARTFSRAGDSGRALDFRFCPDCGSTVYWTLTSRPEMVAVAVGAFADPAFPAPNRSVYENLRHGWTRGADPHGMEHVP